MKKNHTHRLTKFDVTCEEKNRYDKTYDSKLSYGYYSLLKETGKLPDSWYEHLNEILKTIPKDFDLSALEHQEYRRRFHSKVSFVDYINRRDSGKLPKKWYLYLLNCMEYIPESFSLAYTEYLEYCQMFHDELSFYEYYDMKEQGKLPVEWYQFLIQLEETIDDLKSSSSY